ncbi:hypothetical protein L218DRAFT_801942, partial [Marasmius fiardii PR-910]
AIPESVLALIPASQCTTLPIQCCRSLVTADNSSVAPVIALLGIPVTPDTLVATQCTPISNVGSTSCNVIPVCCKNNNY